MNPWQQIRDVQGHRGSPESVRGQPASADLERRPDPGRAIIAERLDEGAVDRRLLIARWGLVPS